MPQLEIRNLFADYAPGIPVLKDVTLDVEEGDIIGIIGPSGSGKSTLMRVLIGLLQPVSGSVKIDDISIEFGNKADLRKLRDRMAIVFQQYNLFQNMTVLRNVMIAPLKIKREPPKEVEERAKEILERVGLADKLDAYPDQLSGGQQQRVAIARALTLQPEILLLDEVTSALDPELVNEVLDVIGKLSESGITMVLVSHEMGFIREVSNRVVMMADGKIVETGPPSQIFEAPETERCREFISNILRH